MFHSLHNHASPESNCLMLAFCLLFFVFCAPEARGENNICGPITLDRLPQLPRHITTGQFSSYNRKGLNGDSGGFLYEDENGDKVIFDATGPGCIRSFWGTMIDNRQIFKFYFDGEKKPRIEAPLSDLYGGTISGFPKPLVSLEKLGYWGENPMAGNCVVPIPFAKSLKISTNIPKFHHFIYERYPYGTPVTTFSGNEKHTELLEVFSGETKQKWSEHAKTYETKTDAVAAGKSFPLLDLKDPGIISELVIEAEISDDLLSNTEIEMRWDGQSRPAVTVPLGMFFAIASGVAEIRSLPIQVEKLPDSRLRMTCRFPMPFWENAQISLVNRSSGPTGQISSRVVVEPQQWKPTEAGYFYALYRDGRTEMGRDWLFCDAFGTGWFLGSVQTMQGGHYCEGDERFTLDGAGGPQIYGTGTEDYYLCCFWPNPVFSTPFAGCSHNIVKSVRNKEGTSFEFNDRPACYYRFHLDAPIPFYSALDARIEHGGHSDIISRYKSIGFYYLNPRSMLRMTDFLDVGNPGSEHQHDYRAENSLLTEPLTAAYEGNRDEILLRDTGRRHAEGELSFTVAIDPDNDGVRLRRRLDQISAQSAEVFIDGAPAGIWRHANRNQFVRWADSDYDLPPSLTRGKEKLNIRLKPEVGGGYGEFIDFRYEIFVFETNAKETL